MTYDFTSFSTVFQSYLDDGRVIMKAVCNGTPLPVEKITPRARSNSVLDSKPVLGKCANSAVPVQMPLTVTLYSVLLLEFL